MSGLLLAPAHLIMSFQDQVLSALATVERVVNNGVAPTEAADQVMLAIEALAKSIPLSGRASELRESILRHTGDQLVALGKETERADQETPFAEAHRHAKMADGAQDLMRAVVGLTGVVDDWLDELLEDADVEAATLRGDYAEVIRRVVAAARLRTPERPTMPKERREANRLGSLILGNRKRVSRLTVQTAVPFVIPAVAAAVAALAGVTYDFRTTMNGAVTYLTDEAIYRKFVNSQSAFARWAYYAQYRVSSTQTRREALSRERAVVLQGWKDEFDSTADPRTKVEIAAAAYASSIERIEGIDLSKMLTDGSATKRAQLLLARTSVPALTEGAGGVGTLLDTQKRFLAAAKESLERPASRDLYARVAEFNEYVNAELRTMQTFGIQGAAPLQDVQTIPRIAPPLVKAAIIDTQTLIAAPPESTTASVKFAEVTELAAELPPAPLKVVPADEPGMDVTLVGRVASQIPRAEFVADLPATAGRTANAVVGGELVHIEINDEYLDTPIDDAIGPLELGLKSELPPDQIMAFFNEPSNVENSLRRFAQLLGYVSSIGDVVVKGERVRFSRLVDEAYARKGLGSISVLLDGIEPAALRSNGPMRSAPTDEATRSRALAYIRAFTQEAYRVDLTSYWTYGRLIGTLAERDGKLEALGIDDDARLPGDTRPAVRALLLKRLLQQARESETALGQTEADALSVERLLGRQPKAAVRARAFNGEALSPELSGKLVYVHYASGGELAANPSAAQDYVIGNRSYQKVYLVRDTAACVDLAECPWAVAEWRDVLKSPESLVADLADGTTAFVRIWDIKTQSMGAAVATLAFQATRAAAGSNARLAMQLESAAPTLAGASLDSTDDSQITSLFKKLVEPVPVSARAYGSTLTDPFTNVWAALKTLGKFWSRDWSVYSTLAIGFESLASIAFWLELGLRLGFVAPLVPAAAARVGQWINYQWDRLCTVTCTRIVDSQLAMGAKQGTKEQRDLADVLRHINAELDRRDPTKVLSERPSARLARLIKSDVLADRPLLAYLFGLATSTTGASIQVFASFTRVVSNAIGRAVASIAAIVSMNGAADTLQKVIWRTSVVMMVAALPTMYAQVSTVGQTAALGVAGFLATRGAVDVVTALLASTIGAEDKVARWRSALLLFGTTGLGVASWFVGSEYKAVFGIAPRASPIFAARTDEQRAVELAMFAGHAIARAWAPSIYGWLRARVVASNATVADAITATSIAFTTEFVTQAERAQVELSFTRTDSPYRVWLDVALLAIEVEGGKMRPSTEPVADQLAKVGANLIRFIREAGTDRGSLDVRKLDREGRLTADMLDVQLSAWTFDDVAVADRAVAAAAAGIVLEKLPFEAIAIYGKRNNQ